MEMASQLTAISAIKAGVSCIYICAEMFTAVLFSTQWDFSLSSSLYKEYHHPKWAVTADWSLLQSTSRLLEDTEL